jgi:hypothetical protein
MMLDMLLVAYSDTSIPCRAREDGETAERPSAIHLGYRGSELGAHYGRLGFLKFENALNAGESQIQFRRCSSNRCQREYVGSFELLPTFDFYWPHLI